MKLCKHEPHTVINWIKDPKWSTSEVLIDKQTIDEGEEHILLAFSNPSPHKKYGWMYFNKEEVQRCKTQPNGRITVYVVSLNKRKPFTPINDCDCNNIKLL
jgi:hypothetical protein